MRRLKTIILRKDRDYVYCFLQEETILEEECNMYEHNIQCDENDDFWGRTHRKGTLAGYRYHGQSGNVLNSCRYCLDNMEVYEEYIIPQEAKVNNEKKVGDIIRVSVSALVLWIYYNIFMTMIRSISKKVKE